MMGHRQKFASGDEWDWCSRRSRRILNWKPGDGRKVKRRLARRERLQARREIRQAVSGFSVPTCAPVGEVSGNMVDGS